MCPPPIYPGEIHGDDLARLGMSAPELGRQLRVLHGRTT